MSYEQVQKQSEEAACLLKLWGFLDNRELWYELIAADVDLATEMDVPVWLLEIGKDELSFADAMGLLSCYSLVESKEGANSYSMHSILHRWCGYLVGGEERCELGCLAAELVASSVPLEWETEFWRKRKRIMAHALCVGEWIVSTSRSNEEGTVEGLIQPGSFHMLGYLLGDEDRQQVEQMYQWALAGYEKAWGADHSSTLDTVNNLGLLYAKLGKLDQAEHMYQRALAGYAKAVHPGNRLTFIPALNNMWALASLHKIQSLVEDARHWYSQALLGCEKTFGQDHNKCQVLRDNLEALVIEEKEKRRRSRRLYQMITRDGPYLYAKRARFKDFIT